jgi:hypothetical protein
MPVGRRGEPGQDALGRVEPRRRFERAGQGPRVSDAVQPEGPLFAGLRVGARDVPAARMGDKPVWVQGALAAAAVGGGVPDGDRPVVAHGIGQSEQDDGIRSGEFAGHELLDEISKLGAPDALHENPPAPPGVDTTKPNTARVWNALIGGKDNFAADREVVRAFLAEMPSLAGAARLTRRFQGDAAGRYRRR